MIIHHFVCATLIQNISLTTFILYVCIRIFFYFTGLILYVCIRIFLYVKYWHNWNETQNKTMNEISMPLWHAPQLWLGFEWYIDLGLHLLNYLKNHKIIMKDKHALMACSPTSVRVWVIYRTLVFTCSIILKTTK